MNPKYPEQSLSSSVASTGGGEPTPGDHVWSRVGSSGLRAPRPPIRWLAAGAALLSVATLSAQEWTRFRGPNGTGISQAKNIPETWSEKDFRWRVPLPGVGHSQPVIWGDRIFLTTASKDSNERLLLCLHKTDGRELWRKSYTLPTHQPMSKNASFANGSPVVDAERVIAFFVSAEHYWVRAFDHAGNEQWGRDLGTLESQHGHGVSPMIFENTVIVVNDHSGESFVCALELQTGKTVWRTPRRSAKFDGTAYGTPMVHVRPDQTPELILTSQSHGVSSLDPRTGKLNWEAPVYDKRMVASPVVAGDLVIGSCGSGGGRANYLSAVRLGGQGDVSTTHVAYTLRQATPYVPTPLYRDGRVYWFSDAGIATAIEAATGREIWAERVRAEFFASPVMIGDRIYCPSTKGEMIVIATGDKFQEIARNPIGEGSHSTVCVDGDRLYIRTFSHLLCVGKN